MGAILSGFGSFHNQLLVYVCKAQKTTTLRIEDWLCVAQLKGKELLLPNDHRANTWKSLDK